MADRTHEYYVKLVEEYYFGSVTRQDKGAILDCFTEDARVTIYHGDNKPRRFKGKSTDGELPLGSFFDHLLGNYDPRFEDFIHYVDAAHDRCAAHFKVHLTPKPDSPNLPVGVLVLQNCNFFVCRDGKIDDMVLYYSNPSAANASQPTPTGFPKQ